MKFQRTLVTVALSACALVLAAPAQAGEKEKLVEKILTLWHIEDEAIVMVQRPAVDAVNQSRIALQGRVSGPKQEATLKDIAVDVQKYIDEATPIVKDNAMKAKAPTLTPLLLQNFNEEELKQLIALLESPVKKKFEKLLPSFERAFGERIAADSRAAIDPKLAAMTQSVGLKLRAATVTP